MLERYFPKSIKECVCKASDSLMPEEIRLRCGRAIMLCKDQKRMFVNKNGDITHDASDAVYTDIKDIEDTLSLITSSSVYAYKEDMARGFITLAEGHRAGLCGECVESDGSVSYIRRVTGINIRIAREIKGCADKLKSGFINKNTLVVAPPGCGKTTLLRDIARILSGVGKNVCIADERRELAPIYNGEYVFDTGISTDVLSGCSKKSGMYMLLRSMNPDVIITDELTGDDMPVVCDILKSGVKVVASYHGSDEGDFLSRACGAEFESIIVLDKNKRARVVEV